MTQLITNADRQNGRYYTPRFLVDALLRLALVPLCQSRTKTLRILDPSCGDGAFLLPIRDWLKANREGQAGRSFQLGGVDIDRSALRSLQGRGGEDCEVHWGDALTGRGFGEPDAADFKSSPIEDQVPKLDWPLAFPEASAEGGFDLVIGNPPFRRELASKPTLDRLKQSPLAKKWQQPRLDLWGYFLHRGLDLLKPGGRLVFILPSYWTASTGARQLIERLQAETTLRDVVLLGQAPLFPGVAGRHLILSLEKSRLELPCRVWDLSNAGRDVSEKLNSIPCQTGPNAGEAMYPLNPAELFQQGGLCLSRPDPGIRRLTRVSQLSLKDRFQVRQGIVENPRRITRKIAEQSRGGFQAGQGVFVLNAEELNRLEFSAEERELLRPYYRGSDVGRYRLADEPAEFLLYLTRETAPTIDDFPNVRAHLERFRSLLENRREVLRGRIAWWHLHWPREESIFLGPRILMPQMGRDPRFVFCEQPAFVGFAIHVIFRPPEHGQRESADALLSLAGLLNSRLASRWFRRFAKHRGASLDISGSVLKRFPIPRENSEKEESLAALVRDRQRVGESSDRVAGLEAEIESLVEDWYGGPSS